MLAVKSHEFRTTCSHVVERQGLVDSTTRRLVADLDWLALRRLVFKSDQEPVIVDLKQTVGESMPAVEFGMEESPVDEHHSNGVVEVATAPDTEANPSDDERESERKKATNERKKERKRLKSELPSRHPTLAVLVGYATPPEPVKNRTDRIMDVPGRSSHQVQEHSVKVLKIISLQAPSNGLATLSRCRSRRKSQDTLKVAIPFFVKFSSSLSFLKLGLTMLDGPLWEALWLYMSARDRTGVERREQIWTILQAFLLSDEA